MVNWELAKRVIPNLYYAGEVIVQNAEAAISKHRHLIVDNNDPIGKQSSYSTPSSYSQAAASTEYLVHNKLEALFAWFQVIVLWHDPYNSLKAIAGLLTSFLLLTYFAPNFYTTIMIILFVYNLIKLWFRHIWPEIRVPPSAEKEVEARLDLNRFTYLHPDLMTLKEFGQINSNLIKTSECSLNQLLTLRREKPVKFCLIVTSILSCTAFIGNRISDMSLLFSTITALLLAPGIYLYILPNGAKQLIGKFINNKTGIEIVRNLDDKGEEESGKDSLSPFNDDRDKESKVVSSQTSNLESSSTTLSLSSGASTTSSIVKIQDETNSINLNENEHRQVNAEDLAQRPSSTTTETKEDDDDGFVIL